MTSSPLYGKIENRFKGEETKPSFFSPVNVLGLFSFKAYVLGSGLLFYSKQKRMLILKYLFYSGPPASGYGISLSTFEALRVRSSHWL